MRKRHIRLFSEKFLQRRDGRFEIILVERGLRLVQQVVQRILNFLYFALWGFAGGILSLLEIREWKSGRHHGEKQNEKREGQPSLQTFRHHGSREVGLP